MMIHAYQKIYLNSAMTKLGEAFDYAINSCEIPSKDFINMFLVSEISKKFEVGEPAIIAGKSGVEIAMDIIYETTGKYPEIEYKNNYVRSVDYWIGWSIAYYQWYSDRSFDNIFEAISYEEFSIMYYTLHEADITKFVQIVDERIKEHFKDTNLKRFRKICGYTQKELSEYSKVSLRSIQMYEQRQKDINKASAETLYAISKIFNCRIEDLLEK